MAAGDFENYSSKLVNAFPFVKVRCRSFLITELIGMSGISGKVIRMSFSADEGTIYIFLKYGTK